MSVLIIAPHPDDETLDAGGTIALATAAGVPVTILTVSAHMPPLYSEETHRQTVAEAHRAHEVLGVPDSRFLGIPAVFVRDTPVPELNGPIMDLIKELEPSVVLCPYPDRHVDHRAIFDAAMVAARPVGAGGAISLVAAYETLSETHWNAPHIEPNFTPNWVVDITDTIDRKLEALACYESQIPPYPGPSSREAAQALAQFSGTQAGFAYGEGFHIVRMTSGVDEVIRGLQPSAG